MTAPEPPKDYTEHDRSLGYHHALNSGEYDIDWLAAEIRLQASIVRTVENERREHSRREAAREANQRHVIAHEIADRMRGWGLGKYATAGAQRVLDELFPISRCEPGCGTDPSGGEVR